MKAFLLMLLAYMTMSISVKLVWNSGYLFEGLYVAMFGDLLTDIVTLPLEIKRKSKGCILIKAIVSLVMTLAVMIYGTINMETIRPKYHTYESSKITESHRAALPAAAYLQPDRPRGLRNIPSRRYRTVCIAWNNRLVFPSQDRGSLQLRGCGPGTF